MEIYDVKCPECGGSFYCDKVLMALDIDLHCPFCDKYFRSKEKIALDFKKVSSIVGLDAGAIPKAIYIPGKGRIEPSK